MVVSISKFYKEGINDITTYFFKLNFVNNYEKSLVEAGGIEPPSERFQSKASTCLFSDLNLTRVISQRQDLIQASS